MEALAAHALCCELPRQGEFLNERRFASMKGGIKTSNLWNSGGNSGDCADRSDVVRLMQRRERHERFKRGHDLVVDQNRGRVVQTTVHHAVADTGKAGLTAGMRRKPAMNGGHRAFMIVSGN